VQVITTLHQNIKSKSILYTIFYFKEVKL